MVIKRRNSTFETNSSSAHTIAMCKSRDSIKDNIEDFERNISADGIFKINTKSKKILSFDFGTDFEVYDSWLPKLMYVICDLNVEYFNILPKVLKKASPKFKKLKILFSFHDYLYYIPKPPSGNDPSELLEHDYPFDMFFEIFGAIDHQSYGMIKNQLVEALNIKDINSQEFIDLLYDFIFNPEYVLIIDSDSSSKDTLTKKLSRRHLKVEKILIH